MTAGFFMYSSVFGRGNTLRPIVKCESYKTRDKLDAPYVTASVVNNEKKREIVVFAVNRSLDEDMELDIDLQGFEGAALTRHVELYSDNLKATNTQDKETVTPIEKTVSEKITLAKHSWNMLVYKY
jgi:alpha-N-arabinofuranosidase